MKTVNEKILSSWIGDKAKTKNSGNCNLQNSWLNNKRFFSFLLLLLLLGSFSTAQAGFSINIKSTPETICINNSISFQATISPLVTTVQLVDSFEMTTFDYYKYHTSSLPAGQKYLLEVSGVYTMWMYEGVSIDAAFLYQDTTVITKRWNRVLSPYRNRPLSDIPDFAAHTYQYCITGKGVPLFVVFSDSSSYTGNQGSLLFKLYKVPTRFTYFWNFGDGQTSDANNPVHTYSQPGTYIVSLTVQNETCTNDTFVATFTTFDTVTVLPAPAVYAGQDKVFYLGYTGKIYLTASANETVQYTWNTGATTYRISVSPAITTSYTVTATNNYGCSANDEVTVAVTDVRCCENKDDDDSKKDKSKAQKCKVMLCHTGCKKEDKDRKKENRHTICVDKSAVAAHLAHGDYFGGCSPNFEKWDKNNEETEKFTEDEPEMRKTISAAVFPNPVKNKTFIYFNTGKDEMLTVTITDLSGRYIATLFNGTAVSGKRYSLPFGADNLSEGIYILRITSSTVNYTDKLIVMKE